jgi:uncharacterized protein DUF5317
VAPIDGNRQGRVADLRLRAVGLFYLAIALQVVAFPAGLLPWAPGDRVATALSLASYGVLVAATLANRRVPGTPLIGAGLACNVAAMLANGGHMPATAPALRALGRAEHGVHANSIGLAHPTLPWLVDRFATPRWVPFASVFSVGDVLIVAGAALLLWSATGARAPWRQQPVETGLAAGPSGTP